MLAAIMGATGKRKAWLRGLALLPALCLTLPAAAQSSLPAAMLTYIPGSTIKLEQVIGDCDWAVHDPITIGGPTGPCVPTASQTVTRADVLGNGLGASFEHNGRLIFLFGDTIGADQSYCPTYVSCSNVNSYRYQAGDPIGWSATTRPQDPLVVDFFMDGTHAQTVTPQYSNGTTVPMGVDDVPNAGISLDGQAYIVVNTGAVPGATDPHATAYSLLVRFDETTQKFTAGRMVSQSYYLLGVPPSQRAVPGHFVFTALHLLPAPAAAAELGVPEPVVLMFGQGQYRASDVYLSYIPASEFWSGVDASGKSATRYFTGLSDGRPTWSSRESDAVPVVVDNPHPTPPLPPPAPGYPPLPCSPWPHDCPTIGNASATYVPQLGLWLMTFDGGRQTQETCPGQTPMTTRGIYFSYAAAPWGRWTTPQLIFSGPRDNGIGRLIRVPACTPAGPSGPTINQANNPPDSTPGGAFAPFMIERFTQVQGSTLKIYYTMSTWNPYTVLKMESDFRISLIL